MVLHEGPVNLLFDNEAPEPPSPSSSQGTSEDGSDEEGINKAIFHQTVNQAKDIGLVENQGIEVDDDNKPAPENIPNDNQVPININLYPGQAWGLDGIDQLELVIKTKKVRVLRKNGLPMGNHGWIFSNLFPAVWLFDCYIKAMSAAFTDLWS